MDKKIDVVDLLNGFDLSDKQKLDIAKKMVYQVLLNTGDPLLNHINTYVDRAKNKLK